MRKKIKEMVTAVTYSTMELAFKEFAVEDMLISK